MGEKHIQVSSAKHEVGYVRLCQVSLEIIKKRSAHFFLVGAEMIIVRGSADFRGFWVGFDPNLRENVKKIGKIWELLGKFAKFPRI